MTRGWRDTLFARLLALMLAALMGSHLVAWWVVTRWALPAFGPGPVAAVAPPGQRPPLPTLGALPPTPGLPDAPTGAPGGPAPPSLPTPVLLLDYGIRILIIALAAGWGARWLTRPVGRMVAAAQTLGEGVARGQAPAPLDETRGTAEVREAARVFNRMSARLATEFRGRGLLMASISHDLRTPLTRMRIRLENLQPAPLAQRCIDDIREMNELVDGAISVFRADDSDDDPVQATDVHALLQAMADDLAEMGQPITLQGRHLVARVKPSALRRALGNLIGNALRHGGGAEVTLTHISGPCILIEDRGPGIPDDQLARVLAPFYRLDPSRSRQSGGAGLGLHIAQSLLQAQGATLSLTNRTDGGLRVTVHLQPNA